MKEDHFTDEYSERDVILLAVPLRGIRPFAKVDFVVDCFYKRKRIE